MKLAMTVLAIATVSLLAVAGATIWALNETLECWVPSEHPVGFDTLRARAARAEVAWPPARMRLLAFKQERFVELWVANSDGDFAHLSTYSILAASGGPGPKRAQGDRQVPEGFYRLPELNPESDFHLSIRIDYPNSEDSAHAIVPLDSMGGDIYMHGSNVSIGCIAMGDPVIEEIFGVAALVPAERRSIVIAPRDFRRDPNHDIPSATAGERQRAWLTDLYARIARELERFPVAGL